MKRVRRTSSSKLKKAMPGWARLPAVIFVVVFVTVGVKIILSSYAATNTTSLELEAGKTDGKAKIVPDSVTSGGAYVQFGSGLATPASIIPTTGALLGAQQSPSSLLASREAAYDRKYDIQHYYNAGKGWNNGTIDLTQARDAIAAGRIPMDSWDGPALSSVTDGTYDTQIAASADAVRALGSVVMIRWCWEMNITVGAGKGACGFDPNAHTAAEKKVAGDAFIAAWRHIHDIFVARGATNAIWVWCPDNQLGSGSLSNTGDAGTRWDYLYPGDTYTDWICVDGYNGDSTNWRSFQTLFTTFYNRYASKGKPLMIGETSSVNGDPATSQNKAQWITDMASSLKTNYPAIKALVWFDQNKEQNWLIDSLAQPSSLAAFTKLAQDCYFNTRGTYPACHN